jgi:TPR repeat protein
VHDAYCNLGNIYALGLGEEQGIPRDIFKGIAYLVEGAQEGSRQAAYTLGCLYEKGEYIPQDHKKACYYLVLATLQKHDQAHRVLIMFQHANKGNYDLEFDDAEAQYGKIQNMRKLYRCL